MSSTRTIDIRNILNLFSVAQLANQITALNEEKYQETVVVLENKDVVDENTSLPFVERIPALLDVLDSKPAGVEKLIIKNVWFASEEAAAVRALVGFLKKPGIKVREIEFEECGFTPRVLSDILQSIEESKLTSVKITGDFISNESLIKNIDGLLGLTESDIDGLSEIPRQIDGLPGAGYKVRKSLRDMVIISTGMYIEGIGFDGNYFKEPYFRPVKLGTAYFRQLAHKRILTIVKTNSSLKKCEINLMRVKENTVDENRLNKEIAYVLELRKILTSLENDSAPSKFNLKLKGNLSFNYTAKPFIIAILNLLEKPKYKIDQVELNDILHFAEEHDDKPVNFYFIPEIADAVLSLVAKKRLQVKEFSFTDSCLGLTRKEEEEKEGSQKKIIDIMESVTAKNRLTHFSIDFPVNPRVWWFIPTVRDKFLICNNRRDCFKEISVCLENLEKWSQLEAFVYSRPDPMSMDSKEGLNWSLTDTVRKILQHIENNKRIIINEDKERRVAFLSAVLHPKSGGFFCNKESKEMLDYNVMKEIFSFDAPSRNYIQVIMQASAEDNRLYLTGYDQSSLGRSGVNCYTILKASSQILRSFAIPESRCCLLAVGTNKQDEPWSLSKQLNQIFKQEKLRKKLGLMPEEKAELSVERETAIKAKYLFFVIPTFNLQHATPVVVNLIDKEIYCLDPKFNMISYECNNIKLGIEEAKMPTTRMSSQREAELRLNDAINTVEFLKGYKLILPSDLLNSSSSWQVPTDDTNCGLYSTYFLFMTVLAKENITSGVPNFKFTIAENKITAFTVLEVDSLKMLMTLVIRNYKEKDEDYIFGVDLKDIEEVSESKAERRMTRL